jgi:hypothetical protein
MKKQFLLLTITVLVALAANFGYAQKPFQGTIKSSLKVEGITDPNILAGIPSTSETIYFGNKSKMVMDLGSGAAQSIIMDGDLKVMYVVIEVPGMGKYYLKTTKEDIDKKNSLTKYDFNYTDEHKMIVGYDCQKVVVTSTNLEDDETATSTVWVTKDPAFASGGNYFQHPGLEGFPLAIEQTQDANGMTMTIITEATELIPNKKLKSIDFLLPSGAVDLKQDKEAQKMFGINLDEDED